ncbi:hypothetical protein TTHERM_00283570 (macronuclear) [Tetrahymena thermophila SB210]|uniref:Uncharacterized protein n=1 Tax=Tetrahymena thermophila (strain SB210) TaxID=312017 RepID=I7MKA7_TETTS|nr:hypothetical protein TTHERM_00283570 [Tetrahymena thermophila SB210]EAR97968.1 hypothetical protein TTHERM_00283570 [Tetrahymena thermophila SB210]|eukprot:XP_001018213.1 hypothetical protein TTHERM_00283570 [Tetrahymena thermophila SB210]
MHQTLLIHQSIFSITYLSEKILNSLDTSLVLQFLIYFSETCIITKDNKSQTNTKFKIKVKINIKKNQLDSPGDQPLDIDRITQQYDKTINTENITDNLFPSLPFLQVNWIKRENNSIIIEFTIATTIYQEISLYQPNMIDIAIQ